MRTTRVYFRQISKTRFPLNITLQESMRIAAGMVMECAVGSVIAESYSSQFDWPTRTRVYISHAILFTENPTILT